MMEVVAALAANAIVKIAYEEFIKTGSGKLGEKFTEAAISKMGELRKLIRSNLQGKPVAEEALKKAEQGDEKALETISTRLQVLMEDEPELASQLQAMAKEIKQGEKAIDRADNQVTQNQTLHGNAKGNQVGQLSGDNNHLGDKYNGNVYNGTVINNHSH